MVSNLHNTHYGCFSLSYICQALSNMLIFLQVWTNCPHSLSFCGNVNTNTGESLQMSYDHLQTSYYHYKCLAINKNGLQLLTNMLFLRILGAGFQSSQDPIMQQLTCINTPKMLINTYKS